MKRVENMNQHIGLTVEQFRIVFAQQEVSLLPPVFADHKIPYNAFDACSCAELG